MKKISIIVAGGSGKRMGMATPKQFLKLGNLPVLMHTISTFHRFDTLMELRLVLARETMEQWNSLCNTYNFKIEHTVFSGGETRFQSVKNALNGIPMDTLIAIHDGVRPFVNQQTIKRAFDKAEMEGSAVPVIPLTESVRRQEGSDTIACNRSIYFTVQTPQVFQSALLLDAYNHDFKDSFTDDASVVEKAGYKIFTCEGNEENLKITTAKDMLVANALLEYVNEPK